jgi:hypothetical protein
MMSRTPSKIAISRTEAASPSMSRTLLRTQRTGACQYCWPLVLVAIQRPTLYERVLVHWPRVQTPRQLHAAGSACWLLMAVRGTQRTGYRSSEDDCCTSAGDGSRPVRAGSAWPWVSGRTLSGPSPDPCLTTAPHLPGACVVVDQVVIVRPGNSADSC